MYHDQPSTPTPSSQAVHPRDSGDEPNAPDPSALDDHPSSPSPFPRDAAELRYRGMRLTLCGRALHLVLWLAGHQERLNATASERGQVWITWKGEGLHSIDGEFRTRL